MTSTSDGTQLSAKMFFSTICFIFVNLIFAQAFPEGDPDCKPPHPGKHPAHECCKIPDSFLKSSKGDMHEMMHTCAEEVGLKKPGDGPPPPRDQSAFDCVGECVFKKLDFVADGEIKTATLNAFIAEAFKGSWAPVGSAAIQKCLADAKSNIKESSKCKSGSEQVIRCFSKELFLNCPADSWTDSDECKTVAEHFKKCSHSVAPLHG